LHDRTPVLSNSLARDDCSQNPRSSVQDCSRCGQSPPTKITVTPLGLVPIRNIAATEGCASLNCRRHAIRKFRFDSLVDALVRYPSETKQAQHIAEQEIQPLVAASSRCGRASTPRDPCTQGTSAAGGFCFPGTCVRPCFGAGNES